MAVGHKYPTVDTMEKINKRSMDILRNRQHLLTDTGGRQGNKMNVRPSYAGTLWHLFRDTIERA